VRKKYYEECKKLGRKFYKHHECAKGKCDCVTVTSFVFADEVGKLTHEFSGSTACHASFNYQNWLKGLSGKYGDLVATISLVPRLGCSMGVANTYYSWLFNKSPWRSVFMNTSAKSAYDYGIVTRTNVPGNLLLGGLIASRLPTEHGTRAELWGLLSKAGCNKNFAVLLSYMYCLGDEDVYRELQLGHCPVSSYKIGKQYTEAFVKGETKYNTWQFNSVFECRGVIDTWGAGEEGSLSTTVRTELAQAERKMKKETVFGAVAVNLSVEGVWIKSIMELIEGGVFDEKGFYTGHH